LCDTGERYGRQARRGFTEQIDFLQPADHPVPTGGRLVPERCFGRPREILFLKILERWRKLAQ
jgi:hypothetical protein